MGDNDTIDWSATLKIADYPHAGVRFLTLIGTEGVVERADNRIEGAVHKWEHATAFPARQAKREAAGLEVPRADSPDQGLRGQAGPAPAHSAWLGAVGHPASVPPRGAGQGSVQPSGSPPLARRVQQKQSPGYSRL